MDYPILNMNELHNKIDEEQWANGLKEILSKYISPKYKETLENICSLYEGNKNFLSALGKRNLKQNSMLCVFLRSYCKTVDFP